MKPSTYRILGILGSVTFLIGAVIVYSSYVKPTYNEIQILRDKQQASAELFEEQKEAVKAVNRLLEEYQSLAQIQEEISLVLPNEEKVPFIVNQLQGIAKLNNLRIESLSLQYPPLRSSADSLISPLGIVRINIRLSGNYRDLQPYLEDLETNIRIMDLFSLNVEGGAVLGRDKLNYNLVLDTYYQ